MPPPIRLLFVSTSTTLGGAEKTLYTLATALDPARFSVAGVVSLKPEGAYAERLREHGLRVYSLDVDGVPGFDAVRRLSHIIEETRPDLVHAIMYQAIQLARFVKRLRPTYALASSPRVNYRTRSRWTLWVDRLLRPMDDLLIAESDASRDYLTRNLGYPPAKIKTIRNGIDPAKWTIAPDERERLRLQLGLKSGDALIGTSGRLDLQKGHPYLLEAVAALRSSYNVHCAILGDGPLRPSLEEQARSLGIADCVHFLGEQADVRSWLSALDIFVLPSVWEGLPNALLESMALGLPVVATNVDGIPEIIESGTNGVLCFPENPASLASAIQELIQKPGLRSRLAAAGRETVASRFKLSDMVASYQAAYVEALGERA